MATQQMIDRARENVEIEKWSLQNIRSLNLSDPDPQIAVFEERVRAAEEVLRRLEAGEIDNHGSLADGGYSE